MSDKMGLCLSESSDIMRKKLLHKVVSCSRIALPDTACEIHTFLRSHGMLCTSNCGRNMEQCMLNCCVEVAERSAMLSHRISELRKRMLRRYALIAIQRSFREDKQQNRTKRSAGRRKNVLRLSDHQKSILQSR